MLPRKVELQLQLLNGAREVLLTPTNISSRKSDARTGRGDRKRKVMTSPLSCKNQMDAAVRYQLDSSAAGIEKAQFMSTPHCLNDDYDDDLSDTDSVSDQRRWPRVVMGQFIYTEQQPNPNGGGDPGSWKSPFVHFNTGSDANGDYFMQIMKKAMEGKAEVNFRVHSNYEGLKQSVFGHKSIAQAQDNKIKKRRAKRNGN
jgi:hypothetical protein